MKLIDLSVTIVDGSPMERPVQVPKIRYRRHGTEEAVTTFLDAYPGLQREQLLDGAGWAVEQISLSTHTGTHVDAPYHYHPTMNNGEKAWTIDEVPLDWFIGNGVIVDFYDKPDGYVCSVRDFEEYFEKIGYSLQPGDIVCLRTNAMSEWGNAAYMDKGCGVSREATLWLLDHGVHAVGTDAWSWDVPREYALERFKETGDPRVCWEGHKAGAEKAYVQYEKLCNLDQLPLFGFRFYGVPVKIDKASAGWVRAFAVVDDDQA